MAIAYEPKDKSGTFWCDSLAELSDLLEMLGDERNAKDEEIYCQGFEDGYQTALAELEEAEQERVEAEMLSDLPEFLNEPAEHPMIGTDEEAAEKEPKTVEPTIDPKIITPPKGLLLPEWLCDERDRLAA